MVNNRQTVVLQWTQSLPIITAAADPGEEAVSPKLLMPDIT